MTETKNSQQRKMKTNGYYKEDLKIKGTEKDACTMNFAFRLNIPFGSNFA